MGTTIFGNIQVDPNFEKVKANQSTNQWASIQPGIAQHVLENAHIGAIQLCLRQVPKKFILMQLQVARQMGTWWYIGWYHLYLYGNFILKKNYRGRSWRCFFCINKFQKITNPSCKCFLKCWGHLWGCWDMGWIPSSHQHLRSDATSSSSYLERRICCICTYIYIYIRVFSRNWCALH